MVQITTHQVYRLELDPNNHQRSMLASHTGGARYAYNWGLQYNSKLLSARPFLEQIALDRGDSETKAAEWAKQQTGPIPWDLPSLRRAWNQSKDLDAPWWTANSKEAYNTGLDQLSRAYRNYFDSRSGKRKGPRVGWPNFKKRGAKRSYKITTGGYHPVESHHVHLPKIGVVRSKESTCKLTADTATGKARILSATVSETAGHWHICYNVEVERPVKQPLYPDQVVGVDLGVKTLATLSNGVVVPNPHHLKRYQRQLARCQRQQSRRQPARGQRGSKRYMQAKARVANTHYRVANARRDSTHKLTTRLARTYGVVVLEDLSVKGLVAKGGARKRGLNRAILDANFGQVRVQLGYKSGWCGSRLELVDRWYPSSKMCSVCGLVKTKLALSVRVYRCGGCGLVLDRDLNAARNLAGLIGTASGAGTGHYLVANAQGEERSMPRLGRCSSVNCEDGSGCLDKSVAAACCLAAQIH